MRSVWLVEKYIYIYNMKNKSNRYTHNPRITASSKNIYFKDAMTYQLELVQVKASLLPFVCFFNRTTRHNFWLYVGGDVVCLGF